MPSGLVGYGTSFNKRVPILPIKVVAKPLCDTEQVLISILSLVQKNFSFLNYREGSAVRSSIIHFNSGAFFALVLLPRLFPDFDQ